MSTAEERPSVHRFAKAGNASLATGTLPHDLEASSARRLGALALVAAIVTALIATVTQLIGMPSILGPAPRLGLIAADIAMSLLLAFAIRQGWLEVGRALRVGVVYQVAHAFLAATIFYSLNLTRGGGVRGWTPVAVWCVVYPLIVPTRPALVWAPTLATALMDPLALWVIVAAGAPLPSRPELTQLFLPTFLACFLAPIAATIVYGLTVEVKQAREMGAYRLVEKLGQGGMGEVWRAEHRMLARGAAIKLIRPPALGAGESHAREMVKRFEREARATAALRSPHTIEIYDFGVAADGTFHYVMELLDGFSLQSLVARFGPVPPERAVSLLRQACHSLAEAHAAGLVHRDIKPANLFVCRLGLDVDFLKVLDFGLVKLRGPQADGAEELTMAGAFTGTPGFISPEMALGAETVDGRADIYALGCVAYWLLTGQRVFEHANVMQMVVDHIRTPPVPPSKRTEQEIPPALETIVLHCLEKEPGARPASVVELSRELEALGLELRWTAERARKWWLVHEPIAESEEDLPSLELDPSRGETVSQVRPVVKPQP